MARSWWNGSDADAALQREIEAHLALAEERFRRGGASLAEARRQARLTLGGIEQAKELHRGARPGAWLADGLRDARLALRTLRRAPAFALTTTTTLALGVGLSTATFAILDQTILRPFPYPDLDRVVLLTERQNERALSVSLANFADWRDRSDVFDELGVYRNNAVTLTGRGTAERVRGTVLSASVFRTLGVVPRLGRPFVDADDEPGARPSVILSERLWTTRFGGETTVVGTTVLFNRVPHVIVGVMPATFRFPTPLIDAWFPLGPALESIPRSRDNHAGLTAIGRVKSGVPVASAGAALRALAAALALEYPATNTNSTIVVTPYLTSLLGDTSTPLWLVTGAAGLVLVITALNFATLLFVRNEARRRELSVRSALGAFRGRLIRLLLGEALITAGLGGAAAAGIAYAAVGFAGAAIALDLPRWDLLAVDAWMLAGAWGLTVAVGLLAASFPALRGSSIDLMGALRDGRDRAAVRHGRTQRLLVIGQLSLAVVLLSCSAVLGRTLTSLWAIDPGFSPTGVLKAEVALPPGSLQSPAAWMTLHQDMILRAQSVPGVTAAAFGSNTPLSGNGIEGSLVVRPTREGISVLPAEPVSQFVVTDGYFETMGIPLVAGRAFSARGSGTQPPTAIIDEWLATRLFPDGTGVGRHIAVDDQPGADGAPAWREIIGVAQRASYSALRDEPRIGHVYLPLGQPPGWALQWRPLLTLLVRADDDVLQHVPTLRAGVAAAHPDASLYDVRTLARVHQPGDAPYRTALVGVGAFAGVALLLAAVGTYGVVSLQTASRWGEFGIRSALGATAGNIVAAVLRPALLMATIGAAVGATGALLVFQLLRVLVPGVTVPDGFTAVSVIATLIGSTLIAVAVPAWRAWRIDPLDAIRQLE